MSLTIKILSGLLLGLLIGIIIGYFGKELFTLHWKGEVKLELFVNLLSAIVIAVFLSQAFQKRSEITKNEASMILEPLKEASKALNMINNQYRASYKSLSPRKNHTTSFVDRFQELSIALFTAKDLIICFEYNKYIDSVKVVEEDVFIYKFGITDGNPEDFYSDKENQKQMEKFTELNKKLHILIRDINRQ